MPVLHAEPPIQTAPAPAAPSTNLQRILRLNVPVIVKLAMLTLKLSTVTPWCRAALKELLVSVTLPLAFESVRPSSAATEPALSEMLQRFKVKFVTPFDVDEFAGERPAHWDHLDSG